jgi:hypothetical protein
MRPIIVNNVLQSARILGDACEKLRRYSIEGTDLDHEKVSEYVGRSLMLVTALSPHIGYDKASAIAHKADDEGSTLREAALALGVRRPTTTGSSTPRRWWATHIATSAWKTAAGTESIVTQAGARPEPTVKQESLDEPPDACRPVARCPAAGRCRADLRGRRR